MIPCFTISLDHCLQIQSSNNPDTTYERNKINTTNLVNIHALSIRITFCELHNVWYKYVSLENIVLINVKVEIL